MSERTPGDWGASRNSVSTTYIDESKYIAEFWDYDHDINEANARFVAAAPDMERALKDFTEHHDCPAAICPVQDTALAALAKAKGGQ